MWVKSVFLCGPSSSCPSLVPSAFSQPIGSGALGHTWRLAIVSSFLHPFLAENSSMEPANQSEKIPKWTGTSMLKIDEHCQKAAYIRNLPGYQNQIMSHRSILVSLVFSIAVCVTWLERGFGASKAFAAFHQTSCCKWIAQVRQCMATVQLGPCASCNSGGTAGLQSVQTRAVHCSVVFDCLWRATMTTLGQQPA